MLYLIDVLPDERPSSTGTSPLWVKSARGTRQYLRGVWAGACVPT